MHGDPDVVTDLNPRGAAVENAADASNEVPPFSPVYDESADEPCLLAAHGTEAGRRLTDYQAAVWPDARPDWATLFGGGRQLTISVGDVWTPGAGRALLQRLLEGRAPAGAPSRRPPAERAVGATGQSTREDQPEPSVRTMPLPVAVTGPQGRSTDGYEPARAQRPRSQPSPLVAALAQAVIDQHAKRAGLLRAVDGMVGDVSGLDECGARSDGGVCSDRHDRPALRVSQGSRGAQAVP